MLVYLSVTYLYIRAGHATQCVEFQAGVLDKAWSVGELGSQQCFVLCCGAQDK